jgi:hypothetical protein
LHVRFPLPVEFGLILPQIWVTVTRRMDSHYEPTHEAGYEYRFSVEDRQKGLPASAAISA